MKKLYTILPLFIFFGLLTAQSDLSNKIQNRSEALKEIQKEISNFKKNLKQNKNREKTLLESLNKTQKQISLNEKLLNQLVYEIDQKRKQVKNHEETIHENTEKIKELKQQIAHQFQYLYKKGSHSDLELLLTAQSINQAFYRYKYLRVINNIHKNNKQKINKKIRSTELAKAKLTRDLKDKQLLIKEKNSVVKNLTQQKSLRKKQLRKAKRNQKYYAAKIKEKEKAAEKVASILSKLEAEKEKREIEIARQRTLRGEKDNIPFYKKRGKLMWPVSGRVVGKFGTHRHPRLKTITENSGIDIKARKGQPVITIADGYVTTITYIRGYGQTIIIDHGDDYYTVYTHIKNVKVRENQYVAKHMPIAEIGESDSFDGTLLHFEIWNKDKKLNPEEWLKKSV